MDAIPSTTDRPFGCPPDEIVHVLDLPIPPSVNRIWRHNKAGTNSVSRAPQYKKWIRDAGMAVVESGLMSGRKTIRGMFTAEIEIRRPSFRADLDNRLKALLDFAQEYRFVEDDCLLQEITARWADIPGRGVRLTLRSISISRDDTPAEKTLGRVAVTAHQGVRS